MGSFLFNHPLALESDCLEMGCSGGQITLSSEVSGALFAVLEKLKESFTQGRITRSEPRFRVEFASDGVVSSLTSTGTNRKKRRLRSSPDPVTPDQTCPVTLGFSPLHGLSGEPVPI